METNWQQKSIDLQQLIQEVIEWTKPSNQWIQDRLEEIEEDYNNEEQ